MRSTRTFACLLFAALVPLATGTVAAQEHAHEHDAGGHGHGGLHFAHPMIAESVSPDRKVRFDYARFDLLGAPDENSAQVGGEWAFTRAFSVG